MKILFLIPYPLHEAPSQRFRFEQYLQMIEENGFRISVQSFWDTETWSILYKPAHRLRKFAGAVKGVARRVLILFRLKEVDFVFIHRECLPVGPPFIEWAIAKILKKKIVYDFDDAIWLPNTSDENRIAAWFKWHSKVSSICKWSYKISCGNSFLARYAGQFNSRVIINPTTIDTLNLHNPSNYDAPEETPQVVIGWTGTHSTLKYLESLFPVLKKLEDKYGSQVRILIIANKERSTGLKYVDFRPWSKQTEVEDLLTIDIGLMPLSDDIWAKGKCGFKALQYMALEIPALVSPVGVNTEIVDDAVNGFYCSNEAGWFECIERLILDKEFRKELGKAGRKKVIASYSVASNSATVLGLFS